MSIRKISFTNGEFYHLYNRGNSKQKIFRDKADYSRFVGLLFACNQKENFKIDSLSKEKKLYDVERGDALVHIGAYCLMPNHFHILVTEKIEGGISKFMQKICTAYSMYYNKKYKRTGTLFEGKFKSQHLDKESYLKYVFSYIHLNPVKIIQRDWKEKGIKNKKEALEYLNTYPYSSYLDYFGTQRVQNTILNLDSFPKYFPDNASFTKEILEWISFNDLR